MLGGSGGRHEPLILDFKYGQHANGTSVLATQAIANVVKSSFGPSGLDKMMVDDIGVCNLALTRSALDYISHFILGCYCYQRRCHHSQPPRRRAPCRQDSR